jgi:hypothetical protein
MRPALLGFERFSRGGALLVTLHGKGFALNHDVGVLWGVS